jgi:hypothetical protein
MKYKIVLYMPQKSTAEKVHKLIRDSKIYHSEEIIMLEPIKEVCDE